MCWNKEVSIITFVVAMLGVGYLYYRNRENDRWIALLTAVVAMIQLAEFFMWSDQTCGKINQMASMFALLILVLEPMAGMIGGLYFSDTSNKNILKLMLLSYICFVIYAYFTFMYGNQVDWCGIDNCNIDSNSKRCSLTWNFTNIFSGKIGIIWVMFLMIPILTMKPTYQALVIFTVAASTYIISRTIDSKVASSLWCWFAISIIFVKILMS